MCCVRCILLLYHHIKLIIVLFYYIINNFMIPCCCSYFCVSLCLYCHILLLVPPFNTRPFVERPATLKYVKRIQQMMLPKPLNFTLQLRPSPPPSCWDVRSNEGHDVVHLKPLGTWPLRILRYSNTSRVSRFQHGISPSQTEIKETNQQVQVG